MDKSIVIAFGRFNPPTTGHRALLDFVKKAAAQRKADVLVFPSQSHDEVTPRTRVQPRNPLPFDVKVDFLERLFPDVNFSSDTRIKTPIDALAACSLAGYDNVYAVVGSDRVKDFEILKKYVKPKGRRGQDIILKTFEVIAVPGNRDPDAEGVSGMSASKMRAAAVANDFDTFRQGVPKPALARQLFKTVRDYMKITESVQSQRAFLLYGPAAAELAEAVLEHTTMQALTPRDILLNSPRYVKLLSSKLPFAIDVRNESYVTIQHLHGLLESAEIVPTVYVYQKRARIMSEDNVHRMTTVGLLKRGLARDIVEVVTPGMMIQSMIALMEADRTEVGLKTPSEVDRMKANQKQQQIMLKTRQAQELLQAKQRELAKKTRDDMNKIKTGEKPAGSPAK
jgi:hypothetical protein